MSLVENITVDVGAAAVSAASVAPVISIIDKAIFSNASGKDTLGNSIKSSLRELILRPHVFLKSPTCLWIYAVYCGTYITANSIQTITEYLETEETIPKFIGSSIANTTLSVMKDRYFTKAYGVNVNQNPVGLGTLSCYTVRDASTIFASFVLPEHVSRAMQDNGMDADVANTSAQLFSPCFAQIFSTPIHLYGMDLYNKPYQKFGDRMKFIKKEYTRTLSARIARIFPAFGICAVLNKKIRKQYHTPPMVKLIPI
ncbi:hypothetical protein BC833DRAFT_614491 [Globomyces pollinis-pini]|nr:hypothetical protein BC833DRAFT_614491 [Globomyces pollinis-pini]